MEYAHGAVTPMDVNAKQRREEETADPTEYQATVASLMYIALATRPEISFAVSALSRSPHSCQTRAMASQVDCPPPLTLQQRCYHRIHRPRWANDGANRKSQGEHVFISNNGAILWKSRKRDLVAT